MLKLSKQEVQDLPLSRHILSALEHWSSKIDGFEQKYTELPFGSQIIIENIDADVKEMWIHLVPVYDVEGMWLSADELKKMWNIEPKEKSEWPDIRDFSELKFQETISEAVSVVRMSVSQPYGQNTPPKNGTEELEEMFIFKSAIRDIKYMYHELYNLLHTPSHSNLIPRPPYLITKTTRFGGKKGVCGFLLPFYPHGTLQTALSSPTLSLNLSTRLRWAQEIVSTIMHISSPPMQYYPDIKPDNIMLVAYPHEKDKLNTILIDLEQRGGWFSWSAPEIAYVEYIEHLATYAPTASLTTHFRTLLQRYIPTWKPLRTTDKYTPNSQGFSAAWNVLTKAEREAAHVFMIGKLLWCIFENVGSICDGPFAEMLRADVEAGFRFPEFRNTPEELRGLIMRCTAGAREWVDSGRRNPVVVKEGKLVAKEGLLLKLSGKEGEGEEITRGSAKETQMAAKEWWTEEVKNAEEFLEARVKRRGGGSGGEDQHPLFRMMKERPSLAKVLRVLQSEL